MHSTSNHTRSGFTLVETVISLSIMSVIFLGLSSALMIASRAVPSATETGQADIQMTDTLNQIRSDLRLAKRIEYRSAAAGQQITFDLNDTGMPGQPTKIVYRYYSDRQVITRETNEVDELVLAEDVSGFKPSATLEDSKFVKVVKFTIASPSTVQYIFEMHVALPNKPEYK